MSYDYDASFLDTTYENEAWPYDGDYAEARPRPRPRPVQPAKGAPLLTPRPSPASGGTPYVTQAQLEAALAKTRGEIVANANAIKTVDGRVRTVIGDMQKLQATTRKDMDKLRADLKTTQTLSALIPLIAPPDSPFASIAPLAHLFGPDLMSGGSSGAGGSALGNNTNLITIGALLFASGAFDKAKPE